MNTIRTIMIAIFTTTISFAQSYQIASNDKIVNDFNSISEKSTSIGLSVSSLSLEVYEMVDFDYKEFLEEAEKSKKSYHIDGERYSRIKLVKIFRKAALGTEDVIEFEQYLKNINPELLRSISERESVSMYYKFRGDAVKVLLHR